MFSGLFYANNDNISTFCGVTLGRAEVNTSGSKQSMP